MKSNYRIQTIACATALSILTALTGCAKSADTAGTTTGSKRPAIAATTGMPEQARSLAAQNAQGAEADAKKRAAAMAKSVPSN